MDTTKKCLCCGDKVMKWQPWGSNAQVYSEHKIIGGGYRNCRCPNCGAIDRHRWLEYVLTEYTDIYSKECKVLHFAPEKSVQKKLKDSKLCWYISGDINSDSADYYIDICDIPFKDEVFDFIIANHVFCYIEDEEKCFGELKRCLKKDGTLIISFPIRMDIDTYSKYGLSSDESEREFGTRDNCRIYGKDYRQYLEQRGIFVDKTFSPYELLSDNEILSFGLLKDDIIIFSKKLDGSD